MTAHNHREESVLLALSALGLQLPVCRRVLIVDDEPDNLDVLEALLESSYEVWRAGNGLEALEVIEKYGAFDLVLSDQRMPYMTGTRFLAELTNRHPETIQILLTAYTDVEPILAAVNRGNVYQFLLKPWRPETLRSAVHDGLLLKSQRQLLARAVTLLSARRAELENTLRDLERAQNQLIAAERLGTLGRITSGITHDINNQLSALLFLTDTLASPEHTRTLRAAAAEATDVLESILRIVSDVNTFAKHREIETKRMDVSVARFVGETLDLLRLELGPDLRLDVLIPEHHHACIDVPRARQALLAILRNAVRAVADGGEVRVVSRSPIDLELLVSDTGIGMTPAVQARAFEPFFSAFEPPGLGIGLGLARMVAAAHGGSIELVSAPGEGTELVLHLPSEAQAEVSSHGEAAHGDFGEDLHEL